MKHRSLGIFIILAATLAAIPQASQELADLRDAVGQRARVELWSAFLALQSGGTRPAAVAPAPATVASCETARGEGNGAASKPAARNEEARREAKEQPRRAGEVETARIIVDPDGAPRAAKNATGWTEKSAAALRHALRQIPVTVTADGTEFAMLVPPADSVQFDADALVRLERDKGEWFRRLDTAGLQKQASFDASRENVRRGRRETDRAREEIRRRIETAPHTKGGEVKGAEQLFKVFKFKANAKSAPPVARAPRPAQAFDVTSLALPVAE